MKRIARTWKTPAVAVLLAGSLAAIWNVGCGGLSNEFLGSPFLAVQTEGDLITRPPTSGGRTGGGGFTGNDRTNVDPCTESQTRKFITISMRNLSSEDHVHYFLLLVAYVNGETYPDGAVCSTDINLYTSFGYQEIAEGSFQAFGNFCIVGPALIYFHEGGQFESTGGAGGASFASAIPPALGASATYDRFFTSQGAMVPIPNQIIFHNPGTGPGASLKIARSSPAPCDLLVTAGDPACQQDSFYYVDEFDILAGSTALGVGSGRRTPSEIQGTGCQCLGTSQPAQILAPSGVGATNARCNEFLRGGRIDYAFLREDTNPSFPQLVWRVRDQSGAVVHDFDARANVP